MTDRIISNCVVPLVDLEKEVILNDMFMSLQGESLFSGKLCTFIRFQGCTNRCLYCDTPESQDMHEGVTMSVDGIIKYVKHVGIPLVEFTGGEPLLQMDGLLSCVFYLLRDTEYTVLVETNGGEDISPLIGPNPKFHIIMDIKMPSSGEQHNFRKENIELLNPWDEVKMVCAGGHDLEYAKEMLNTFNLPNPAIHAVDNGLMQETIVSTIIDEKLPVRFGIQLHKLLNIV